MSIVLYVALPLSYLVEPEDKRQQGVHTVGHTAALPVHMY